MAAGWSSFVSLSLSSDCWSEAEGSGVEAEELGGGVFLLEGADGSGVSAEVDGVVVASGVDCAAGGVVWGAVCEGAALFAVGSEDEATGALSVGMGALAAGKGVGGLGDAVAGAAPASELLCVESVAGVVAVAFLTAILTQSNPPRFQCM